MELPWEPATRREGKKSGGRLEKSLQIVHYSRSFLPLQIVVPAGAPGGRALYRRLCAGFMLLVFKMLLAWGVRILFVTAFPRGCKCLFSTPPNARGKKRIDMVPLIVSATESEGVHWPRSWHLLGKFHIES